MRRQSRARASRLVVCRRVAKLDVGDISSADLSSARALQAVNAINRPQPLEENSHINKVKTLARINDKQMARVKPNGVRNVRRISFDVLRVAVRVVAAVVVECELNRALQLACSVSAACNRAIKV